MTNKLFLYKDNSEDRDCCAYIERNLGQFECDHYFGRVSICGAAYYGGEFADYEDITTVLTAEEYAQLLKFVEDISALGYGIKEGDERYQRGIELRKGIQPVLDKLNSKENEALFDKIWEEEKEYLYDEYSLDDDECEEIANEYGNEYRDRGIVSYVFDDAYDCGYEEAIGCGFVDSNNGTQMRYFNFEKFGEDLAAEDERYHKLDDGRIVVFNY